jgi:hypothetical protein
MSGDVPAISARMRLTRNSGDVSIAPPIPAAAGMKLKTFNPSFVPADPACPLFVEPV